MAFNSTYVMGGRTKLPASLVNDSLYNSVNLAQCANRKNEAPLVSGKLRVAIPAFSVGVPVTFTHVTGGFKLVVFCRTVPGTAGQLRMILPPELVALMVPSE